jgi:ABC-2 type transport system permease protein
LVFTIAARELRAIFATTIGWLVLAGFLFLTGLFWIASVQFYAEASTDVMANPYSPPLEMTDHLLAPFFGNWSVLLIMLAPALSMRLFSDELRNRTMDLLLTSPISTAEIVLGKYLGAIAYVALMLAATFYIPLMLWMWAKPDWGALAGGYASTLLVAAGMIAIGMLISAMTPNAIVALVSTFAVGLSMFVLTWIGGDTLTKLSLVNHMEDFVRGAVQLSDVVYFVAFVGFFLFATHQRVEGYRWR